MFFFLGIFQTARANDFIISLRGQKLTSDSLSYKIDKIIDARVEKNCLGFVHAGVINRKTPAYFKESFKNELSVLLNFSGVKYGNRSIIMRINRLMIYEAVSGAQMTGFAEANVSFIEQDGDSFYELAEIVYTSSARGMEVTVLHAENIQKAISHCLSYFEKRLSDNTIKRRFLGKSVFENEDSEERNYLQSEPNSERGIFWTFADFRDNLPDNSVQFQVKYIRSRKGKVISASPRRTENLKVIRDAWGFTEKGIYWIRLENQFFQKPFIIFSA